MLTKNAIETYFDSSRGRNMTDLFTIDSGDRQAKLSEILQTFQDNFHYISVWDIDYYNRTLASAMAAAGLKSIDSQEQFSSVMEILAQYKPGKYDYRDLAGRMSYYSISLWMSTESGSIFYPIMFGLNYRDFQEMCLYAGIDLPDTPPQRDKKGRVELYYKICEAIENFRIDNSLTKPQVCALIYGYLKAEIDGVKDGVNPGEELPAPTRIWWAGASKGDVADGYVDEDSCVWQCNENCRRGDIVVLYARSPYCRIHSIWRAGRDSQFEPFDYYCDRIIVTDRVEVPPVTIKELKADERTRDWKVVRKQMQGMNQFEVEPRQYNTILEMLSERGMDISGLPNLEAPSFDDMPEIVSEKDVEEKLLIPLLVELGYNHEKGVDWDRQFKIKLGHKVHGIPDFVIFPKTLETGQGLAPMVIEVKEDFGSIRNYIDNFNQGVSYVNPLQSKYLGMCDRHMFRAYQPVNGFWSIDKPIFQASWRQLKNPEVFNRLKRIMGRDVLARTR